MTVDPELTDWQRERLAERDAMLARTRAGAERVAEQRQRILNAATVTPDLPDTVTCALVGMSFVPGYPENVRELERELSRRYWANTDNPKPLSGELRRNPDNQYDPNAVEFHFDALLGHLPRKVAGKLASEMDSGIEWAVTLIAVRTHPDNPNNPGVDVRLTRLPPSGTATIEDVIREAVRDMQWCEVDWELGTRGLARPDDRDELNEALVRVYLAERAEKTKGNTP